MIYFFQAGDDGPVKIGFAKDVLSVKSRLSMCQTGSPQKLHLRGVIEGSREDEQTLHRLFSDSRIRGEWFQPTEHLLGAAWFPNFARYLLDWQQCVERYRSWGVVDYEGRLTMGGREYLMFLERRDASGAVEQGAGAMSENNQYEDRDLVRTLTDVVRNADERHEAEGGSTRHWVRDHFLPLLNAAGLAVSRRSQ